MKKNLLSDAVWLVALKSRLEFLIYRDEYGNAKEIQEIATELYDHANELRYQARQQGLQDVERLARRAMDFSDAVIAE